ncbi:MAG TPA: helix-turn-helix domain-containing protein [Pyrinomonadaceae bacterium]|jgi:tetratricopeptide (TPR) repeat protein
MRLVAELQRQIDDPTLTPPTRAKLRCQLAKELEERGDYEAARRGMGELWRQIGQRPRLDDLDRHTAAEVLMRAGSLTGWIGGTRQIEGAQEIAKDLITESIALFEELSDLEKVCEAQVDLSVCYWREGAFDEARVLLRNVPARLAGRGSKQEVRAWLMLSIIERAAKRDYDSLRILLEAAPLFESSDSHALKGAFHNQLGMVLKSLGSAEHRSDYIDRSLIEYAAASYHFGQAGHVRFRAVVENNLGYLFLRDNRYREAHEHLDRAQRLFVSLKDEGSIAQVNDTRARAFLAEGRSHEAERVSRAAVRTLEKGDGLVILAEALRTHGIALARVSRREESHRALVRACLLAERAGDRESAGLASLTIIEELSEHLTAARMQSLYDRADELLAGSQNVETLSRLRACASRVMLRARPPHAAGLPADVSALVIQFIRELEGLRGERVKFEPAALEAVRKLWLEGNRRELRALLESAVLSAESGTVITKAAVEVLAMRRAGAASLVHPWQGCSLREEVLSFESRLVKRALEAAEGSVTRAARLLGITHQRLCAMLHSRHKNLLLAKKATRSPKRTVISDIEP